MKYYAVRRGVSLVNALGRGTRGVISSHVWRAEVKAGKLRDIVMSNSNKRAETELVLFATVQKLFQKTVRPPPLLFEYFLCCGLERLGGIIWWCCLPPSRSSIDLGSSSLGAYIWKLCHAA